MWIGNNPLSAAVGLAAASSVLIGTLNAAALLLRPFTIMRSRGFTFVDSDQNAASEAPFGVFGMIVVTDSATAAGIASIPTPTT